jgi:hypothetical protein
LDYLCDWEVTADNFSLSIQGDGLDLSSLATAVETIVESSFWQSQEIKCYLLDHLSKHCFSKFQKILPDHYALEIVQNNLLDIDGMILNATSCLPERKSLVVS